MMNVTKGKIIALALIPLLVLLGFVISSIMRNSIYSASLNIEVTPTDSIISTNGKNVKEGVTKVKPGEVEIIVRRDGFEEEIKKVNAIKNELTYVGIVLLPNSDSTLGWYNKHPEDLKKTEGISSKSFDESSKKAVRNLPFILKLPYLGPGLGYRIDYGGGAGENSKPVIYIKAKTEEDRLDALNWIKNQGVNPDTLQIIFQ